MKSDLRNVHSSSRLLNPTIATRKPKHLYLTHNKKRILRMRTNNQAVIFRDTSYYTIIHISRATCQKGVSTKWLIYRRLNSYVYLVWQMCIISVHTPKCSSLYLRVEQHHHYTLLAWHTSHYFMLLDQISPITQICWNALLAWCPRLVHICIKILSVLN
jgi:hypothetical protein